MENPEVLIGLGVALVGMVSTLVYYFARFYFAAGQEDPHSATREVSPPSADPKQVPPQQDRVSPILPSQEPSVTGSVFTPTPRVDSLVRRPADAAGAPVDAGARQERPKEIAEALSGTKRTFLGRLGEIFSSEKVLAPEDLESLEEVLYTSDLGPKTVQRLMESVGEKLRASEKGSLAKVREALRDEMLAIFARCQEPVDIAKALPEWMTRATTGEPQVWMIVGVNGAGKTTTIGKLAHVSLQAGRKVMVVAADTFRAAAQDQLKVWGQRAGVDIFSPDGVKDPSAVAFEGLQRAKASGFDVVIVDTAGRLHTQANLMEELKKIKRVMGKVLASAPHEILLVIDANAGQNSLHQAASFHEALALTGVILTKLDGSAKGGVIVGIAHELQIPIKAIGVGEGLADLRAFRSTEFVDSIL